MFASFLAKILQEKAMSVTSINDSTNLLAPLSKPQAKDNNQSNVENNLTKPNNDTVTISSEAKQLNDGFLQTDPIEIVASWEKNRNWLSIPAEKKFEDLRPENQLLINKFEEEMQAASQERKGELRAAISTVSVWGDEEVFRSESDVISKNDAFSEALNIVLKDVVKAPDKYGMTLETMNGQHSRLSQSNNFNSLNQVERSAQIEQIKDMIRQSQSDQFSFIMESRVDKSM